METAHLVHFAVMLEAAPLLVASGACWNATGVSPTALRSSYAFSPMEATANIRQSAQLGVQAHSLVENIWCTLFQMHRCHGYGSSHRGA